MTRNIDGRKAVIIGPGKQYRNYGYFARKHGYPDAYVEIGTTDRRGKLENGDEVTLLVSGKHGTESEGTLWIVEKSNGDRYIIGESGLDIKEAEDIENVTVLTDELGLQREYREVKRKAAVGERIKVVKKAGSLGEYTDGSVLTVTDAQRWRHPVDENGVSAEGVSAGIFHSEYVVLEPTDIVRIGTERYRLVERKANVGERVVVVNQWFGSDTYRNGDVLTIDGMNGVDACVSSAATEDNPKGYLSLSEYRVLEPVGVAKAEPLKSANPDVLGLIANLSTRLAEAERKIAALEGAKAANEAPDVLVSRPAVYRKPSYAGERPLTRDDVIERAKADVADLSKPHWNGSGDTVYKRGIFLYKAEFIVNRDKRTVVCLLRKYSEADVEYRGIAKCAPDDVFNVHIGKALALRRALGLDVPDAYVNAPKPTEAKVGDIVTFNDHDAGRVLYRVDSLGGGWNCTVIYCDEKFGGSTCARGKAAGGNFAWARIVDDSRDDTEVTA